MKKQRLLMIAICMVSSVLWQSNVYAQRYAAYGFSEYCSVWTGLSNLLNILGGSIEYDVTTSAFKVYCDDTQTPQLECYPGTQNSGLLLSYTVPITLSLQQILNGVKVRDCVDLTQFITPEMCTAIDPDLEPIPESAHVEDVDVDYTIKGPLGNEIISVSLNGGDWSGTFDNNSCTPSHGAPFIFDGLLE